MADVDGLLFSQSPATDLWTFDRDGLAFSTSPVSDLWTFDRGGLLFPILPAYTSGSVPKDTEVSWADPWALDYIEVRFSAMVRNDSVLKNPSVWSIAALDGGQAVSIRGVHAGEGQASVDRAWLIVTYPTEGKLYRVTAPATLMDSSGNLLSPSGKTASFVARKTKIDSMLANLPSSWNKAPDSTLRILLNAIGRMHDLLGGSRRDLLP